MKTCVYDYTRENGELLIKPLIRSVCARVRIPSHVPLKFLFACYTREIVLASERSTPSRMPHLIPYRDGRSNRSQDAAEFLTKFPSPNYTRARWIFVLPLRKIAAKRETILIYSVLPRSAAQFHSPGAIVASRANNARAN